MENLQNTVEELFEKTKNDIREILKGDMVKNIKTYVFKVNGVDHKFDFENEDFTVMLENLQTMNLGLMNEATVKDVNGNEIVLNKVEYANRSIAGFKNKKSEELDFNFLEGILNAIEQFADFVNFKDLATAKEYYMPKVELQPEVEEEVVEPEEVVEEEVVEEVEETE